MQWGTNEIPLTLLPLQFHHHFRTLYTHNRTFFFLVSFLLLHFYDIVQHFKSNHAWESESIRCICVNVASHWVFVVVCHQNIFSALVCQLLEIIDTYNVSPINRRSFTTQNWLPLWFFVPFFLCVPNILYDAHSTSIPLAMELVDNSMRVCSWQILLRPLSATHIELTFDTLLLLLFTSWLFVYYSLYTSCEWKTERLSQSDAAHTECVCALLLPVNSSPPVYWTATMITTTTKMSTMVNIFATDDLVWMKSAKFSLICFTHISYIKAEQNAFALNY